MDDAGTESNQAPLPDSGHNAPVPASELVPVIDDEVIRERVRKILGEPQRTSRFSEALKHPLLTLSIGFLLTWGVGTLLTGQFNREREARQRRVEEERMRTEGSMSALVEWSRLFDERLTRGEMFLSSLRRNAPAEELRDRRREYDDVHARWGSNIQANLLMIRTAARDTAYNPIEAEAEQRLQGYFTRADSLLMRAYDAAPTPSPPPDLHRAYMHLDSAKTCGIAIVNQLYRDLNRRLRSDQSREREAPTTGRVPMPGRPTDVTSAVLRACRGELLSGSTSTQGEAGP